MRLRSLESRIVTLFLVLILAVQLVGFIAIRTGIKQNAQASIRSELPVHNQWKQAERIKRQDKMNVEPVSTVAIVPERQPYVGEIDGRSARFSDCIVCRENQT